MRTYNNTCASIQNYYVTITYVIYYSSTDKAIADIIATISSNKHLQEIDVSRKNLQSTGAIQIAKALQNISTLIKLYINDNHIIDEAADDIAAALSCN